MAKGEPDAAQQMAAAFVIVHDLTGPLGPQHSAQVGHERCC